MQLCFEIVFNLLMMAILIIKTLIIGPNHSSSESTTAKRDGKSQGEQKHFTDTLKAAQVTYKNTTYWSYACTETEYYFSFFFAF